MTIVTDPLKRGDYEELSPLYVRERKDDHSDPQVTRQQLPPSLRRLDLGETDAALVEFILACDHNRILNLQGPRGAGKTSTVHFVESALRRAGYKHTLLILDGLGLSSQAEPSPLDFVNLLHMEAKARVESAPTELKPILRAIATATRGKNGVVANVNAAVSRIATAIEPVKDKRLLTFVFDNLDHLAPSFSVVAADLAKILYVRTGLGAIMCLRRGSGTALYKTNSARAFFGWYQAIRPPKVPVWIRNIGRRIRYIAETSDLDLSPHPAFGALTPQGVERIFNRFASILDAVRPGDTVLNMLDAMSADDTRHLILLIRRMLTHRTLPEKYLMTGEGPSDFHPIPALIEGSDHIYRSSHDSIIPNLLWFSSSKADPELLLGHHLLALLDTKPARTEDVIGWLGEFGYSPDDVVSCLKQLVGPILIKLTDSEIWDGGREPEAIYLSAAGDYYRNHFLRFTDYLALVVTDVPLDHVEFRRSPSSDSFAPRLASLLEYAQEVRRRENQQISELMKRPPSARLRRVAMSLDRGGLLTAALVDGLREAIDRGRNSKSGDVRDAVERIEPAVNKLEAGLHAAEERLREVMNRGRRDRVRHLDSARMTIKSGTIDIGVTDLGDTVRIDATLRSDKPIDAAFVAIRSNPEHGQRFGQATLLTAPPVSGLQQYALSGRFGEVGADQLPPIHTLQADSISMGPEARRLGLLSVTESSGSILNITLHTFDRSDRMVELGGHADANALEIWARERLEDISNRLVSGQPFSDRIYSIGVMLAERVLSLNGRNALSAHLPQVDHLIIFSSRLGIPWEWMVPRSLEDPRPTPAIGDTCRITRWPWNPFDGVVRMLSAETAPVPLLPLSTFGLAEAREWRHPSPKGMADIANVASRCATLHLVGHFKEETSALQFDDGWEFDELDANGTPLIGPKRIVVSGCNAAAADKLSNLVTKLSAVANIPVWGPMVKIRDVDAARVDDALAAHPGSVDDFMKWRGDPEPLTRLYVRYGLPI